MWLTPPLKGPNCSCRPGCLQSPHCTHRYIPVKKEHPMRVGTEASPQVRMSVKVSLKLQTKVALSKGQGLIWDSEVRPNLPWLTGLLLYPGGWLESPSGLRGYQEGRSSTPNRPLKDCFCFQMSFLPPRKCPELGSTTAGKTEKFKFHSATKPPESGMLPPERPKGKGYLCPGSMSNVSRYNGTRRECSRGCCGTPRRMSRFDVSTVVR